LSAKPTPTPTTRRERRAAERRDRYDAARDDRRTRTSVGPGSSLMTTRNLTIGAVALGVLLIAVLAIGQLGGTASAALKDPALEYPAAVQNGAELGSAAAPVTLEVWGDFQCPICARNALDVEPSLVNRYVTANQLRIVHHEMDILGGGGDESRLPAIGAWCAKEQDRYWAYDHWVYENQHGERQGGFARDRLVRIAVAAGLDEARFTTCLDSKPAADAFAAEQAQGEQLGINQTPTMLLNGTRSAGLKTAAQWAVLIDAELAKAGASPAGSAASSSAPSTPGPSASAAP
jgi:protein-disulfide isomerase